MAKDVRVIELRKKFGEIKELFDIERKKRLIQEIEDQAQAPDFWKDKSRAQKLMGKLKLYKKDVETIERVENDLQYLEELEELKDEEDFSKEFEKELSKLQKEVDELEIKALFKDEEDTKNAILSIHPGAGGTESQDWAEMLMRMYLRWIERRGFKYKIIDLQPGDVAGIKDVTIYVEGEYAYGYLKAERGVHRLVRISPFDANQRRHTSFASVFVYPEAEDVEVEIRDDEIRIDTFRSSGPGGQHMQKNETAVRITHIPTGIVVTCQSERSQHQNKTIALKILKARLYNYYKEKEREKLEDVEKEKGDIAWGNQIRSYILHPYKMVKDHRTGLESGNPNAVLDGDIDEFIKAFLLMQSKKAVAN